MKSQSEIKNEIKNYIVEASLSDANNIKDDTLIFDDGLLDSMGLLFLIEFLNENYKIEVNDEELNPKNFESINSIISFVETKL
jgi:acyl carrier protein